MTKAFRKFFRTKIALAKVDPDIRRPLMGHSQKDLDMIYPRFTEDESLIEYQKAIPLLTIDKTDVLEKELEKKTEELSEIDLIKLRNKEDMRLLQQENKRMQESIAEVIDERVKKVVDMDLVTHLNERLKALENKLV